MSQFTKLIGAKAVKKATAVKKSTAPQIKLSSSLSDELDAIVESKATVKAATAVLKQAEDKIIAHAKNVQDTDGLNGKFSGTYELVGENHVSKFISSDRFTVSQDKEVHEALVDVVGQDAFDDIVEEKLTVSLRSDVFSDPAKQDLLVSLLGDKFDELFETTVSYGTTKELKSRIYGLVKNDADKLEEVRSLLPQYKPSIR
jgi:hypothetical protein